MSPSLSRPARIRSAAWSRSLLLVAVASLMAGCAMNDRRSTDPGDICIGSCAPFVTPPRISAAIGFKVLDLRPGNEAAKPLVQDVEGRLAQVKLDGKPYYTIVDGGGALKPEGIVTIGVNDGPAQDSKDGNNCLNRKVTVTATVRLTAPGRGQLIAARELSNTQTSVQCEVNKDNKNAGQIVLGSGTVETREELTRKAHAVLAQQMRDQIGVKIEMKRVQFIDDPLGIKSPAGVEAFKSAIAFGKADRLDRACTEFENLRDAEPDSYPLIYNIGYCRLARGRWGEAGTLCRQADALTNKPVSLIGDCINLTEDVWRDEQDRARGGVAPAAGKPATGMPQRVGEAAPAPAPAGKPVKPATSGGAAANAGGVRAGTPQ